MYDPLVLLFLVSQIGFMALNRARGGPLSQYALTPGMTTEAQDRIAEQMGLNRPLPIQYADWLCNLVQSDWGKSYRDGRPVLEIIACHLPTTLQLMGTSTLILFVLGTWIGIARAVKQGLAFGNIATVADMLAQPHRPALFPQPTGRGGAVPDLWPDLRLHGGAMDAAL
ncbi:ABC transporter permease [Paracoccus laeviglucosivorans]|uniref:ABC transporter type 1 GsiC-like N-terminal domain-containing protein n=1 Tax=Paracoccus laeviglucosivorans TaxID=1197861 RepID=A0A521EU81_9RHOB|nr:ABC transporter permease [Paracoccus laeviglucosivorans]SMO87455.1 hypothetical protein SAMN06265221_11591 [Paracoccus laeviglucosivorans]